ncbi:MAG TPA: polysaccharide biosynthesis tyrosine autokinase [Pyrinomonadaceae bacterium]|nr:polysaccharide biosynthesis tyrosine autokinase [Pyrinomonadaceae bacterium]
MGRVYEALKRAAEQKGTRGAGQGGAGERSREAAPVAGDTGGNGNGRSTLARGEEVPTVETLAVGSAVAEPAAGPAVPDSPERLLRAPRHFNAPEAAHSSASTGRTGSPGGSALPGGAAPRDAGATLGAAGSARTPEFVTIEISAARVEPHLVAITEPRSGHAERFRSLRTRVLHAGERKKMRAFVITSAGIMEGKTLTAVNLSWLLAQTDGVSALLIDGDLRNPCAADYLGLDAPVGLSEVLAGEARLEESILRLEPAGLHLLPGGSARDDVAELLSGPRFSAVLAEARRMFDYVIIDAPPLAIFTDATVLIGRADAALIVARANRTRYGALEKLLEPLPRERLLGVVLNGSDEEMNEQNYYYYRRYRRRAAEEV